MSSDLVERLRLCATHGLPASYNDHAEAADRIEALEIMVAQLQVDSEPSPYCPICGSCGDDGCCGSKRCLYPDADLADRIEALEAENERLRGVLEAVWKEATTMRNASKLVGPYPKEPANNRVWARSMYHAGKKLHALIKPVRAALGEKQ